ncbi:MAG: hypothetical protein A2Z91_04750 [Deltaproteobacteria bacterium GWA2_38_16]|nr:MAG: hypothetical protein A2Z91_04750 [Deltaproteobacteria bacterium GWA2_38_16]OGQ34168.1 MAG: hypothetical protein A3A72_00320 [Deltaproteobacteria bacterium RIFCSPLOWO2_01_FULL_38_9]OGQ61020.1 MAG: hypothetical protein A3G92_00015 [Deltaproteobacteria bacterium RIFCSPLOWO2_12_FULL_38_8]HBQ21784.1 hypothetical protein [Deltaproteobacteria bacterium]
MSNFLSPDFCFNLIAKAFSDEEHPAYCQVGTVDLKNHPQLRTVHVHYIAELKALAINTHTKSAKWQHLKKNPILSGCYLDEFRQIQFRWESKTTLIHKNHPLLQEIWLKMRAEVRTAYWLDYKKLPMDTKLPDTINVSGRPPTHGVIICTPYLWNVYELNEGNYLKGVSTLHTLKGKTWHSKVISIVTGK